MVMEDRDEQSWNVPDSILVIPGSIFTLVREVQPEKAMPPRVCTVLGMVILRMPAPEKALFPISVIEEGISKEVIAEHPPSIELGISVRPLGRVTLSTVNAPERRP